MKKKSITKGEWGYINKQKLRQLIITLILLLIVLIIFYTGVIKFHNTKNIFTVLAAVSVIPAAKTGVSYLVMISYKTSEKRKYEELETFENITLLSDLLITSTEKIMNLGFAVIIDNSVYCFCEREKTDLAYVEKYVRSFLESECKVSTVKAFNDFDKYKTTIAKVNQNEKGKYDKRIRELMIAYSM